MAKQRARAADSYERGAWLVLFVLLAGVCMTVGWLHTGHDSAPDHGLQQIDMLTLHERVNGVRPVGHLPTLIALSGRCATADTRPAQLSGYGLVVHRPGEPGYARLADALALPEEAARCSPGYALLDSAGFVRYRTYDRDWRVHADEQQILLDAL